MACLNILPLKCTAYYGIEQNYDDDDVDDYVDNNDKGVIIVYADGQIYCVQKFPF